MKKRNWKTVIGALTLSMTLVGTSGAVSAQTMDSTWRVKPEVKSQLKQERSSFIRGKIVSEKVNSEKDAKNLLKNNPDIFGENSSINLVFVEKNTDELGMNHYVFQPSIQNIPIDQSKVIVHTDKDGNITAVNGEFNADAPKNVKQMKKLSKKDALDIAWKHIKIDRKDAAKTIKSMHGDKSALTETSDLVVLNENDVYTLAYHVQLQFSEPYPANWQIWVNAETGEVLKAVNQVYEAVGSGTGVLGDTKSLNTYFYNNTYYLIDTSKPMNGVIETLDNNNGGDYSLPGYYVTSSTNKFTTTKQRAAVDAHYYAGKVFDYYYSKFKRLSYDNRGADIISTVHYGSNYNNAAWIGNQMIYGDGDGRTFTQLSGALDVVAHELTHAVTQTTANLAYQAQPGALNESFSDVFGYFLDPNDWLIGEDVYTPGIPGDALRSLSNPTQYGQPDHMRNYQNLPITQAGDWGGVHTNSGIPNKAAYNTITSIGITKAEQIYYRALTVYLTPNSSFSSARQALVQAAQDLYGSATANSVATAWSQVGVN
ncbi:M4 family metallopeptidase [Bacillus sp. FJAT-49736]|uniref:M4 family metallopeptidase n=1 Tax=Bacillus sp. FJAT-49736 TaxID=2833582 RepID=UPI0020168AEB|nr:M4 family metallopeptidase [Bacillus sp. FJAT-49736]